MTRLPDTLRDSLDNFLADNRDVPYHRFCLLTFLAEAMLCAEANLMQGDGFDDIAIEKEGIDDEIEDDAPIVQPTQWES